MPMNNIQHSWDGGSQATLWRPRSLWWKSRLFLRASGISSVACRCNEGVGVGVTQPLRQVSFSYSFLCHWIPLLGFPQPGAPNLAPFPLFRSKSCNFTIKLRLLGLRGLKKPHLHPYLPLGLDWLKQKRTEHLPSCLSQYFRVYCFIRCSRPLCAQCGPRVVLPA